MSWCDGLEAICRADVPLRDYTWYRLGGPARWFVEPRDEHELAEVLARCQQSELAWRVLGHGANVLVPDAGFDGVVIHLAGAAFTGVRREGNVVLAGAGADFPKLVKRCLAWKLGGLEGLAGIPGTVGGVIRMNAGGRYGEVASWVREVRVIDRRGQIATRRAGEIGFTYRHTALGDDIVVRATFLLEPGDGDTLRQRFQAIWREKQSSQPALTGRTAGCIFKNPAGDFAGRLIDAVGLKGTRHGEAEISTRHANFIVAYPGATARDVVDLAQLAKDRVRDASGIELELEIEVW
ncbi:MAG: UDP-N-acetylmuramate dehydrogenase [Planctomycetes bacterium]|nr:UDP-N-acetylmuramate dehydrogenase [Planctomycetota bacterium]